MLTRASNPPHEPSAAPNPKLATGFAGRATAGVAPRLGRLQRLANIAVLAVLFCSAAARAQVEASDDRIIPVFDEQSVEFDKDLAEGSLREHVRFLRNGQQIERTIRLPNLPANMRDARRIVATLIVEPEVLTDNDLVRPADPWTRLGSITIGAPRNLVAPNVRPQINAPPSLPTTALQPTTPEPPQDEPSFPATTAAADEIELMRFVTPFGGPATYTADLTAFAPLLEGETSLRVWISTWTKPAWKVTLTLAYTSDGAGYRRPRWATPIFNSEVTAEQGLLKTTINVPEGLARPRLHLISTGHATDGMGGDEFISRMHVLRIDGFEVARWRPWSENGGPLRSANPTSGRMNIDGRQLWASDLDRSGWHPGLSVDPLQIPLPELTPGKHSIELEILNIRSKDESGYGYWRVSAIVVADEPWPPGIEESDTP